MSRREKIREWFRAQLKKLRRDFEREKDDLRDQRDEKIEGISGPTVMFDSIDVSRIPKDAEAVAGYVNGTWATMPKIRELFPKAKKLSIAVNTSADADCLDVEPGNARPEDAPAWVRRQINRGLRKPYVYANLSTMPAVLRELKAAGFDRDEVKVWIAHYTGKAHICDSSCGFGLGTRADGTQWIEDHARNLDISELRPDFFQQ